MPEKDIGQILAKAKGFFEKARKATEADDFDSAIEMYLEGLRCTPDAVREGHIELRELGLLREARGGQKPSKEEKTERLHSKTALERMLGAEYLLAKDPSHLPYADMILKAAAAGGYRETAKWIADLMFLANNNAKKPSLQIYLSLKDSYASIGQFDRAAAACQCAVKLRPGDGKLIKELKKLLSEQAAVAGEHRREKIVKVEEHGLLAPEEESPPDSQLKAVPVEDNLAKAKVFFERARRVAETDNFDYAIDMYLEGLRCAPDALVEGHIPLCELALRRLGKGGKKPSMADRVKRLRGKTPFEQMINAEYLFAKDPDHLPYAEAMLKAAVAGGYHKTAKWIANLVFQTNNAAEKPSLHVYLLLKDSYLAVGDLERALAACQCATRLKPEDGELADEFRRISTELTLARGKYDQAGDFRESLKDREGQEKLQAQDGVVKTKNYRLLAVESAREKMAKDPEQPVNILNLAEVLSDLRNDESENEAIGLLEDTYKVRSDFSFKQRAGQLRIKQLKRKIREAKSAVEGNPDDEQAKSLLLELSAQLDSAELEHHRLCVENYPTDLRAKYEYGMSLLRDKRYDDAIPMFQESQRDLRCKISAMSKTGMCFFMKGWFADAIDVFTRAIDSYEIKDDGIAKELQYNLARSYEEQGNIEKAVELYRKIAQLDFAYKDVRQRVDELRGK
jgi:tetratricopeptide (TPR) repeat protein